jgi:hypothetical protein
VCTCDEGPLLSSKVNAEGKGARIKCNGVLITCFPLGGMFKRRKFQCDALFFVFFLCVCVSWRCSFLMYN